MEKQKTIKIGLELSEADAVKLVKKAHYYGFTVSGLLTQFVNDLVNGQETAGSDERELAASYLERLDVEGAASFGFVASLIDSCFDASVADEYRIFDEIEEERRELSTIEQAEASTGREFEQETAGSAVRSYYEAYQKTYDKSGNADSWEEAKRKLELYIKDMDGVVKGDLTK